MLALTPPRVGEMIRAAGDGRGQEPKREVSAMSKLTYLLTLLGGRTVSGIDVRMKRHPIPGLPQIVRTTKQITRSVSHPGADIMTRLLRLLGVCLLCVSAVCAGGCTDPRRGHNEQVTAESALHYVASASHRQVEETEARQPVQTARQLRSRRGDKEQVTAESALHHVASAYYRQVEQTEARQQVQTARQVRARRGRGFSSPALATGGVTDRSGLPVGGADVVIEAEASDEVLGQGTTDDAGRFKIALRDTSYRGLKLLITKQGYAPGGRGAVDGGIVDCRVRMDRAIDVAYLSAVAAQADPEQRLWMLLEVIGYRQTDVKVEEIYSSLGSLRPYLLEVIRSSAFAKEDGRRTSPAGRATRFLRFWRDPADSALFVAGPPIEISGRTIKDVCDKWADHHFKQERVEKRPENGFNESILGPEKKHALVTFAVWYANWGYAQHLVLVRHGEIWKLELVEDQYRWHLPM